MALTQLQPFNLDTTGTYTFGNVTTTGTITAGGSTVAASVLITSIQITDSSYNVLDDTAISTSGGYIKITGSGFKTGAVVIIGSTNATATGFVNSTTLTAQIPALSAASYQVYVVNTDGSVGLSVNGLTASGTPTWITGSSLSAQSNSAYSISLDATDAVSYQLQPGSSLPAGLTLTSGGLLSGTVVVPNSTVYTFTIDAIDAELQNSARTFSLAVAVGQELYVPSGTTLLLGFKFNDSQLTQSGSLTASAQTLTYQTSGGVLGTGYATGWNISQGIAINWGALSVLNKTYVAWYKGTQTNSGGTYSPSVPIFSDSAGAVWWGFGTSAGKISISNGSQITGTTDIATNQWFCLAWTVSAGGVCNGFVNGVKEITNTSVNTSYNGPTRIGSGYAYAGTAAPTALDAVEIFDSVLSDAQILEIYQYGA